VSSNQVLRIGRRHLLAGIGGFALSIPFLPSLEKPAAGATTPARPRYFYLGTDHGGCWDTSFFPSTPTPTALQVLSGHTVQSGPLAASVANGSASLSQVLRASASTLTPALVAKMNVLRGLDVPWYIAHNTGQHLGNFARNDNNGNDGAAVTALGARPTIDQIMANSQNFYTASDIASTTVKACIINSGRALSWGFSNPAQGAASPVQSIQGLDSSLSLFNNLFGGVQTSKPVRPPVIDKVLASYNSLRQGNTRLSSADKMRLDAHIAMLSQLQQSLNAHVACTVPAKPGDDAQNHRSQTSIAQSITWGQLFLDVVSMAFACGASRIGVFGFGDTSALSNYTGTDWHHDVAHQWYLDAQQALLSQSYQNVFEHMHLYLAAKLDQMTDVDGRTVLDNSLVVWSQECAMETHDSHGVQVVTFGGGGGYLSTGLYCDYRNQADAKAALHPYNDTGGAGSNAIKTYVSYPGLLYEQWLATQLLAMGIAPSEFELWKDSQGNVQHGYGTPYVATSDTEHYTSTSSPYFATASTPLPFLKA
jgi:Protein of unknown function (DUF1552)